MLYSFSHPYFVAGYLAYKKLKPVVDKWIVKHLANKPPLFPLYRKVQKNVFISPWHKGIEVSGNLRVAKSLAAEGHKVYLLPVLEPDVRVQSVARRFVLPKGVKAGKNPDAYVDGKIFEFKTLGHNARKNNIQLNIKRARKQADNILIKCSGTMPWEDVERIVRGQALQHRSVKQVWVLYNDKLHKFIKESL